MVCPRNLRLQGLAWLYQKALHVLQPNWKEFHLESARLLRTSTVLPWTSSNTSKLIKNRIAPPTGTALSGNESEADDGEEDQTSQQVSIPWELLNWPDVAPVKEEWFQVPRKLAWEVYFEFEPILWDVRGKASLCRPNTAFLSYIGFYLAQLAGYLKVVRWEEPSLLSRRLAL